MPTCFIALEPALLIAEGQTGRADDWRTERALTEHEPECLAVSADAPDRVFCGTFDAGLWRSTDRGTTWERVGADVLGESITAVTVSSHDPQEVWAGTEPSRVYHSTDGGDTWEHKDGLTDLPSASSWSFPPRPDTHHVRWIAVDPADPAHLYVSIEAGALVQTHDGGNTWEDRRPDARRDNHSIATHSEAPDRAWAAAGDGYAETHDGGESWIHPRDGLEHRYCWSVAVDAADPETVLLSAAHSARQAHREGNSYVYRRVGTDDWGQIGGDVLPTGEGVYRAVMVAGSQGGEFYAANNHGLFRTTDAGDSWSQIDMSWDQAFVDRTVRDLAIIE